MKIWIAHVITESLDHYHFAFTNEPKSYEVIEMVCNMEDGEDLCFYMDTTGVYISQIEVIENYE